MTAHVSETKKEIVKEFVDLIKEYPIIAAVNVENLPAKQLQKMREKLRGRVVIKMTKRRLLKQAFEQAEKDKPGITQLSEHLKGMPALIVTDENPFSLFKTLKKNKSNAPIKAGQTAPNDIVVPAGPTGFAPGPIIGELGGFGIKSGIDAGKVAIKEDSTVAKEGDIVSGKLAEILTRLGIEPMEVGLALTAAYENGEIMLKDALDIDEEAYKQDIIQAVVQATNLSFNTAYPTKETITLLLSKAANDSLSLALEKDILTDKTTALTLAKGEGHAVSIARTLPDEALSEAAKAAKNAAPAAATPTAAEPAQEEKKEDKKEEKKEETTAGLGALFG